jgi:AraC-like DNA-binding protein
MKNDLLKEITPLTNSDCFTIFSRTKTEFDFPLHYHEEFEINLIINASGAKRIIGDHIGEIDNLELVLVGPNLPHCWVTHHCKNKIISEITIQFHKDLIDEKFLGRNQLFFIKEMFEKAKQGIHFSIVTANFVQKRIIELANKQGFLSVLELMSILHLLSTSNDMQLLSGAAFSNVNQSYNSRRVKKVVDYLNQHFDKPISLANVANLANMTEVSFSRFFKQHTGNSFIDNLLEIRLSHASRLLIDTHLPISQIAFNCGFNNISNFNRIFKKKKSCTPKEFREDYANINRVFI